MEKKTKKNIKVIDRILMIVLAIVIEFTLVAVGFANGAHHERYGTFGLFPEGYFEDMAEYVQNTRDTTEGFDLFRCIVNE